MEGHQFHHKNQRQHQQQQQNLHLHNINNTINVVDVSDRFPQWSIQETNEFLLIRAELDQTFMETKRNKQLWEVISNHMKEKGYHRSAEQCKCKWKNLVTRYKGCETMETEVLKQQFPFYNELQTIFTARMQRMLWTEAEDGSKKKATHLSTDDDEDDGNEESEAVSQKGSNRKKKKAKVENESGSSKSFFRNLKEILDEFMRQQLQIEAQWMEAFEARENERRLREMEWRQQMEMLENERILMEQRWREREEQRRIREEARAEKRDALITALLNKLERQ
ncbi:putative transcription factor MYB family [Medicago truncatula]|uniref:Putative transcription factor MYB family n=1 Tax=Medicago truncatula TaxID=3880 RepID=G7JN34_MEDTR|nr:trihelix transcription factor GT-3b [Medicago truncatula]AES86860.1 trihelix transcription factor GT-3a-like protein [Medicago truncatula]RHN58797.1 putative transcription factor MYB family [Medicago truncatula]